VGCEAVPARCATNPGTAERSWWPTRSGCGGQLLSSSRRVAPGDLACTSCMLPPAPALRRPAADSFPQAGRAGSGAECRRRVARQPRSGSPRVAVRGISGGLGAHVTVGGPRHEGLEVRLGLQHADDQLQRLGQLLEVGDVAIGVRAQHIQGNGVPGGTRHTCQCALERPVTSYKHRIALETPPRHWHWRQAVRVSCATWGQASKQARTPGS
jgi:hypothetical protein